MKKLGFLVGLGKLERPARLHLGKNLNREVCMSDGIDCNTDKIIDHFPLDISAAVVDGSL